VAGDGYLDREEVAVEGIFEPRPIRATGDDHRSARMDPLVDRFPLSLGQIARRDISDDEKIDGVESLVSIRTLLRAEIGDLRLPRLGSTARDAWWDAKWYGRTARRDRSSGPGPRGGHLQPRDHVEGTLLLTEDRHQCIPWMS
jgi:hypothetical protein